MEWDLPLGSNPTSRPPTPPTATPIYNFGTPTDSSPPPIGPYMRRLGLGLQRYLDDEPYIRTDSESDSSDDGRDVPRPPTPLSRRSSTSSNSSRHCKSYISVLVVLSLIRVL